MAESLPCVEARHGGRLPIELVDQVIQYVYAAGLGDLPSLRSCALTCHHWNNIARTYIFRRVDLTCQKRLRSLERVVENAPHIANYIREMTVGPMTSQGRRHSKSWLQHMPENLSQWLDALHTVRFIRLSDAGEFCDAEFFSTFYYFTSVKRLILEDCAMNLAVLKAFACSLPGLTELIIVDLLPLLVTVWEAPPLLTTPPLTKLVLDVTNTASPTMENFMNWLFVHGNCGGRLHTLHSVEFGFTILDTKVVTNALNKIGSNLKHLGLHIKPMFETSEWEQEFVHRAVDIGLCPNLTSLTVDLATAHSKTSFFMGVKAKELRTLSFRIDMKEGERPPDFESLSDILLDSTFSSVENVQFLNMGDSPLSTVEDAIAKALPNFYNRGMLQVLNGRHIE
ncbi:hypothetical protein BDY19DRAFT_995351 [Irpex rosettiformis]|uniref:Uncharacterized protein n=1 Tax=Irpex rosettiformis TaxID=378272 RepID=A0ACB8TXV3_9APHY|nr:hypothetical protein BDY19DRAFT_995351 [Irpex rosettiformis]